MEMTDVLCLCVKASPWRLSPERVDREEMEERIETESAAVLSDSKPLSSLKAMLTSV